MVTAFERNDDDSRDSRLRDVLKLIRLLQRKNRFVGSAHGTELSLPESHILVELDADPEKNAQGLVTLLGVEKSVLSRTLDGLMQRKLLKASAHTDDRRKRRLEVTEKGKQAIAELDRRANASMNEFCSALELPEQGRLLGYFRTMGDGFGMIASPLRLSDHPFRPEIRRITRGMQLIGNHIFSASGLSSLQWHVLAEIAEAKFVVSAQQLCRVLAVQPNTMSMLLSAMFKRGWLSRTVQAHDRRSFAIDLTVQGRELLSALEKNAAFQYERVLKPLTLADLDDFIALFRRFVGGPGQSAELELQPQIVVRRLGTNDDLAAVRGFLLTNLVRLGRQWEQPPVLLGEQSIIHGLFSGKELKSLCEMQPSAGGWVLSQFVSAVEQDSSQLSLTFLDRSLRLFFSETGAAEIRVFLSWMPVKLPAEWKVTRSDGKFGVVYRPDDLSLPES